MGYRVAIIKPTLCKFGTFHKNKKYWCTFQFHFAPHCVNVRAVQYSMKYGNNSHTSGRADRTRRLSEIELQFSDSLYASAVVGSLLQMEHLVWSLFCCITCFLASII